VQLSPGLFFAAALAIVAAVILLLALRRGALRRQRRVATLTAYLGHMNAGDYRLRPAAGENFLSPLEDELYKTIVLLREGREQAAAARQSLADNLADIAHQLKTPLSSIALLADLLTSRLGGEDAPHVNQIAAQAERMSGLVSALLALSRIDAGTLALEQKPVDVGELCLCARDAVAPLLARKNQTLRLPDVGAAYIGDMEWSIQAVANILKNCSEHTPESGEIVLTCAENPLYTAICVEDTGPGIPPEDLPHLFERFYRGKNAAKDSAGIGLALARALVEAQNGNVTAENRREGGARFLLKFYHSM
jgi:signal transduction histidine kinase